MNLLFANSEREQVVRNANRLAGAVQTEYAAKTLKAVIGLSGTIARDYSAHEAKKIVEAVPRTTDNPVLSAMRDFALQGAFSVKRGAL